MNSRAFSSYVTSKRLISPSHFQNTSAAASNNTKNSVGPGVTSSSSTSTGSSIFNLFNTSKLEKKTDITLYTILGVSTQSSDKEIKSAYKNLSKQYHPDLNPNGEVRFRTINEAYKLLMDPVKRKLYDSKYIITDASRSSTSSTNNTSTSSRSIIRFDSTLDIQYTINISESELKSGKKKKFMINRRVICKECCCAQPDNCCSNCNGTRFHTISEVVRVNVEPGTRNGQIILVSGKGDENLKIESRNIVHYLGNLVFTVSVSS